MKVLANDGIAASGKALLEANGYTVITETVAQDQLEAAINKENYEVLLVRSATTVRQPLIDACPDLKLIGRGGVGMDNIDVDYARGIGRHVRNTPAASSQSVAELVMAHLFGLVRFLPDSNRKMPVTGVAEFKKLKKAYGKGSELRGKTLGVIGFGRIGQSIAQYALGCGMSVAATSMEPGEKVNINITVGGQEVAVPVTTVALKELLSASNFITINVPAQANGEPVIGESEFNKMKDGAYLINAARGGVVDESAMLSALDSGKLAGAGVDVFENEPTPREDILTHSKVSVTPHIGAATAEAQDRIGTEMAQIIIDTFGKF